MSLSYYTAILGPHNRQEKSGNIVDGFRPPFLLRFFRAEKLLGSLGEIDRRRCLASHARHAGCAGQRLCGSIFSWVVQGSRAPDRPTLPYSKGNHHRRGRVKHGGNWTTAQASPLPHENVNFDGIGPNGHTGMAGRHPKRRGRIVPAIRNPITFAIGALKMP